MHDCPDCYSARYCGGDIDDMLMEGTQEERACSHCDGQPIDDFDDDDNDDGARTCDHPSTHEEAGGFIVCSDCGSDVTARTFAPPVVLDEDEECPF